MKKIAILIDGGFIKKKIKTVKDPRKQAERIVQVAHACVDSAEEELYRIFYYDCAPFSEKRDDLAGNPVDFSATPQYGYQRSFLSYLAKRPYVAVRLGEISFRDWKLKPHIAFKFRKNPHGSHTLNASDFKPDFQQKGVDMRIGLDIALLAIDGLVERVALVTADSDFIPAMKLARREGLQIVLISLANKAKPSLLDHADIYRNPPLAGI
ncbi:MAG: NYN domain-containing protein [bacterium]|nr:NYN domain-containing protein [bacterium]